MIVRVKGDVPQNPATVSRACPIYAGPLFVCTSIEGLLGSARSSQRPAELSHALARSARTPLRLRQRSVELSHLNARATPAPARLSPLPARLRRCVFESRERPVRSSLLSARSTPASADSRQSAIRSTHAPARSTHFRSESKPSAQRMAACAIRSLRARIGSTLASIGSTPASRETPTGFQPSAQGWRSLPWEYSAFCLQPQRGCIVQPRVAEYGYPLEFGHSKNEQ